jgi:SAM-dependent methyltransferase
MSDEPSVGARDRPHDADDGHPLVARLYDPVMAIPERFFLHTHREYLAEDLSGTVLDVGAGTGAMFPYFGDDAAVTAVEPDPYMRSRAVDAASDATAPIDVVDASAERLPYDADTFDAVVASFVFCTIPDAAAALDEVARVLRPGGEFRFAEHVRARDIVGWLHDIFAPGWYHVAGGCNLDRETGDRFRADERFELLDYRRFESGAARLIPVVRGRLERRSSSSGLLP